ncbi:MAG: DUF3467 domain-containing protein [Elusimicrobiota bacterium]|nr:DUF3467 domain-containing protein [Elusimicrobiota bacterium]
MSEIKRYSKGAHSFVKWDKHTKEVKKMNREERKIQIEIDKDIQKGVYANMALISHTKEEIIFDFAFLQPQQPKASVVSRVIMSPAHAKRFMQAAAENLKRYESSFGEVSPSRESKIGF